MSLEDLLDMLRGPMRYHNLTDSHGAYHFGMVQAIEFEDGSGTSFNVRIVTVTNAVQIIHVRTI